MIGDNDIHVKNKESPQGNVFFIDRVKKIGAEESKIDRGPLQSRNRSGSRPGKGPRGRGAAGGVGRGRRGGRGGGGGRK